MTDSWEDFDLDDNDPSEIPRDSAESGGTNANGKELAWDDEEELSEGEAYAASVGMLKKMEAKITVSRSQEAARIAAKHESSLRANENPEERRMRVRARVEETEQALAAELLGEEGLANVSISGQQVVAGIEGMQIKTLQEHVLLAMDISLKLRETNNPEYITVFLKELMTGLQKSISLPQLEELMNDIKVLRDAKSASETRKEANMKKQEIESKKRKDEQKKQKVHKDIFGGAYDTLENEYDEMAMDYADKYEQDFM